MADTAALPRPAPRQMLAPPWLPCGTRCPTIGLPGDGDRPPLAGEHFPAWPSPSHRTLATAPSLRPHVWNPSPEGPGSVHGHAGSTADSRRLIGWRDVVVVRRPALEFPFLIHPPQTAWLCWHRLAGAQRCASLGRRGAGRGARSGEAGPGAGVPAEGAPAQLGALCGPGRIHRAAERAPGGRGRFPGAPQSGCQERVLPWRLPNRPPAGRPRTPRGCSPGSLRRQTSPPHGRGQ